MITVSNIVDAITRWILSSETTEQLDVCGNAINTMLVEQFSATSEASVLNNLINIQKEKLSQCQQKT